MHTVAVICAGVTAWLTALPATAQEVHLPDGVDHVTLPLQADDNHIILPISVNGSDPLPMVLDTGMPTPGIALFAAEHVEGLNLEYSPMRAQIGGAGGDGKRLEARVAQGAELGLGVATIAGARVIVMPPIPHFNLGHAGIIGLDLFENFTVTIDYDRSEVILSRPGTFSPSAQAAMVPLETRNNLPYIKAGLPGATGVDDTIRLALDLGASHAVSLNVSSHAAITLPVGAIDTQIGRGLSGPIRGHVGRLPVFELGGYRLDRVVATYPVPRHENPRGVDSLDGNLGMGVMSRFNFTLDYAAKKLYLEPNESFADPFEWDMMGMVLEPGEGDTLTVTEVLPSSPAEVAGLQPGDVVVAIDGEPVAATDRSRVRKTCRRAGAEVSVRFKREGAIKTVRVTLRRLV